MPFYVIIFLYSELRRQNSLSDFKIGDYLNLAAM